MFYFRIVMIAVLALRVNLLRSLLAMLGVIIGVAAVVAAMSILKGASREILDKVGSFGSNVLSVYPTQLRSGARMQGQPRAGRSGLSDHTTKSGDGAAQRVRGGR